MPNDASIPLEERLAQLLRHLGLKRVHIAGRMPTDFAAFVAKHPEAIASVTLVSPATAPPASWRSLGKRLLVFNGDAGPQAQAMAHTLAAFSDAGVEPLPGFEAIPWADVVAEHGERIAATMTRILGADVAVPAMRLKQGDSEAAGITCTVRGSGPPLLLFPLALAPSQWEPIEATLAKRFTTISIGGPHVGIVASLEARSRTGYINVVHALIERARVQPGDAILEVGCGPGSLVRWLARRTNGANRIVGADINRYLLREAAALAKRDGLSIEFREGNAESLPFPDASFNATFSSTVMEEVDADRMLAEMVRVTKPGGRVAVAVRGEDVPNWFNVDASAAIMAKVSNVHMPVGPKGCGDASLYARFHRAGLLDVQMFPQYAAIQDPYWLRIVNERASSVLSPAELAEWKAAVQRAIDAGAFLVAIPHHCAVGTKRSL